MKNKEIVKEIKGMQAKLETLIGKIEKPEKLTLGGHEVGVTEDKDIILFGGGFIYIETAHKIVDSNIEAFRMSGQPNIAYQVDELKELLTKIDTV